MEHPLIMLPDGPGVIESFADGPPPRFCCVEYRYADPPH
jgi:hypothetical protein